MIFSKLIYLVLLVLIQILIINGKETKLSSESEYSKIFQSNRKDSKKLLGIIREKDSYELKYQLIKAAFEKLLQILQQTENVIKSTKYDPLIDAFPPKDQRLFDAITITLENTCTFGDIILHIPDISYRVLDAPQSKENEVIPSIDWRDLINWGIKYTRFFNERIIDSKTQELLFLVDQEINPDHRTPNFVNPYREKNDESKETESKKKKPNKKLSKEPRMVSRDEF